MQEVNQRAARPVRVEPQFRRWCRVLRLSPAAMLEIMAGAAQECKPVLFPKGRAAGRQPGSVAGLDQPMTVLILTPNTGAISFQGNFISERIRIDCRRISSWASRCNFRALTFLC